MFVMPDLTPEPLGKWVATWKSLAARQLVASSGILAPVWQRDYFDRFIRTTESYGEKWEYMRLNPVRAGLTANADDWPYEGVIHNLGP